MSARRPQPGPRAAGGRDVTRTPTERRFDSSFTSQNRTDAAVFNQTETGQQALSSCLPPGQGDSASKVSEQLSPGHGNRTGQRGQSCSLRWLFFSRSAISFRTEATL